MVVLPLNQTGNFENLFRKGRILPERRDVELSAGERREIFLVRPGEKCKK